MEPLRVVVIDDEANTCTFLKAVFEAEGHGCHTFLRAEEAEQYVANNEVDLVMVDVYLGALNGIDLLQRLRALRPNAYPIIMTANVSVETAIKSTPKLSRPPISLTICTEVASLSYKVFAALSSRIRNITMVGSPTAP